MKRLTCNFVSCISAKSHKELTGDVVDATVPVRKELIELVVIAASTGSDTWVTKRTEHMRLTAKSEISDGLANNNVGDCHACFGKP